VAAYGMRRRTHEIGVRMALGARGQQVVWLILRQNLTWLAIGTAAGLGGAFALTRLLTRYLYSVRPTDASTFAVILLAEVMIAGLASSLPTTLTNGLTAHGVPHAIAHEIGQAPPVASLFAAFLGYNPVHQLLAPTGVLAHLPADQVSVLTGRQFFPELISGPFHHGLVIVFSTAIVLLVIAAGVSLLRGGRYVYEEHAAATAAATGQVAANGGQPAASGSQPPASRRPPTARP